MNEIISRTKCTGCSACCNICPQNAINMEVDDEGFKYPVIDNEKCIDCGLCKDCCPTLKFKSKKAINKCYAAYINDEKLKERSSSGGIFPLIARSILKKNGVVIGAAFDNKNQLKHIAIHENEELIKLQGSKYLQSDLCEIFKYIKKELNKNTVLFVGTPCQVAGLKAFLKKDYENLICIDLICHGVPSPKLFEKYKKELEKQNGKLIDYNFKDKSTGWDSYSVKAVFENKEIIKKAKDNDYMKLFLSHATLRESCYNCNFKLGNKYSDMTIGDFWGVHNFYPEMYNKNGVSAIIINTEKGLEIFKKIENNIKYQECRIEEILKNNKALERSIPKHKNRCKFYREIDKYNIKKLSKKYSKKIKFITRVKTKINKIMSLDS